MNTPSQISGFPCAYPPRSYEIQLKDHILGIAVGLTEWIQRELTRLQKNELPRHCQSYETLIEVIDDPTRFQMSDSITNSNHNCCSDCEDDEISDNENRGSCGSLSPKKSDKNINSETQNKYKSMSPPPIWLCRVFVDLIRYCNRGSTTIHTTSAPRLLLNEFEKLRNDKRSGKAIDVQLFKKKLLTILFGKIQLTQYLVKSWKAMCEWVSNYQIDDIEWLELSQNAYFIAQRLCIYETTHHRLQQQHRQNKKSKSTPLFDTSSLS
ncbi:hypothetical protein K501DRAFT_284346 [Backusella circina FSU 941]|nr:hypothetical protein K501DRAFT_284346 [Backusella circina FSU 941]